ncbi:MAG: magnesium/cobalt transporter CorA [Acidimicrobiia bacterium]|nr:magnesium/cobalt transporter CorA [Acidimicrobiia bacterium]
MARTLYFASEVEASTEPNDGWVWIDVDVKTEDPAVAFEPFDLNPMILEDVTDLEHFPKIDDYGDQLFVVLHSLGMDGGRLQTVELDAVVGDGYLLTAHPGPVPAIDNLWERAQRVPSFSDAGPGVLLGRLAEGQGRRYLPLLEELEDRVDDLESRSIQADGSVVAEVQALRRDAIVMRRVVGPQREVLLTLSSSDSSLLSPGARRIFASVYDHHYRMVESLDAARSLLASILDTYRSAMAERMNEVMKVLTVYAAILLPLSLLAGIYGMNFTNMPELQWRYGYFILIGIMASVALGQWIYFARRGFIGRPPRPRDILELGLKVVAEVPRAVGIPIGSPRDRA